MKEDEVKFILSLLRERASIDADLKDLLNLSGESGTNQQNKSLDGPFERLQVPRSDNSHYHKALKNGDENGDSQKKNLRIGTRANSKWNRLSINQMKAEIKKQFPDSDLAKLLEDEPDTLSAEEFLAKASIWVSLSEIERRRKR